MAKMNAYGCTQLAQAKTVPEVEKFNTIWVLYTLRSDGAITRKIAFKRNDYSNYTTYSSAPIVARIKKDADLLAVFGKYCARHGATVK